MKKICCQILKSLIRSKDPDLKPDRNPSEFTDPDRGQLSVFYSPDPDPHNEGTQKWHNKREVPVRYDLTIIPATNKEERNRTIWLWFTRQIKKKGTVQHNLTRIHRANIEERIPAENIHKGTARYEKDSRDKYRRKERFALNWQWFPR
jgi:hypothetical protein